MNLAIISDKKTFNTLSQLDSHLFETSSFNSSKQCFETKNFAFDYLLLDYEKLNTINKLEKKGIQIPFILLSTQNTLIRLNTIYHQTFVAIVDKNDPFLLETIQQVIKKEESTR